MGLFADYLKSLNYDGRKKLKIFSEIMKRADLYVVEFIEDRNPYIFVSRKKGHAGVRVYEIGNKLAFRVQNLPESLPYGKAFGIDIQNLLEEILESDSDRTADGAALLLIAELGNSMKSFFKDSIESMKDDRLQKGRRVDDYRNPRLV